MVIMAGEYARFSPKRKFGEQPWERGMGVGSDPVMFEQQMKQKRRQLDSRYQAIQNDLMRSPVYQQIYERDSRFSQAQRSIQQN